jgi:hypothetical protein
MDCETFKRSIPNYLEGIPDKKFLHDMEEHRASCASCAKSFAFQRLVIDVLTSAEPMKAPAGLADRIMAAAEAQSSTAFVPAKPWYARPTMVPLAAAVVFIAGALAYLPGFLMSTLLSVPLLNKFSTTLASSSASVKGGISTWFSTLVQTQFMTDAARMVQIPDTGYALPMYVIVLIAIGMGTLGVCAWSYFNTPVSYGMPAMSYSSIRRG